MARRSHGWSGRRAAVLGGVLAAVLAGGVGSAVLNGAGAASKSHAVGSVTLPLSPRTDDWNNQSTGSIPPPPAR